MGFEIATSILINASPARVHEILCDFAKYPDWNPFFKSITGSADWAPHEGQRILLWKTALLGYSFPLPATVTRVTPLSTPPRANQRYELRWGGGMSILLNIAEADHYFICEPVPGQPNKTNFKHGEIFGGMTSYAINPVKDLILKGEYERFNQALKVRAETWRE
ncbi:uncharacterized protein SPPG_01386 [Spizellomyces punctatus DAOM BR117]|uniref:Coenzyme Q-binding protein COQ10 START domain-containing protein n=1 Tax=Spizellomyces punctatus (strain DAOM BR117) TaxID=645134 RepID=A0A0L0HRD4_SPIPD|nr:uncharacterized protein SPPG_01386 [Spizellomyces punctatus DAOM BR117]KND03936.1 hypothetical protein SPPG_01386 [Spizellomyces punctatus DAOM BR117]|eukprot:XP_016611975.1 hypothetical protein SPPG_01386 [Spizellomyces punctatus DAOM BR117]